MKTKTNAPRWGLAFMLCLIVAALLFVLLFYLALSPVLNDQVGELEAYGGIFMLNGLIIIFIGSILLCCGLGVFLAQGWAGRGCKTPVIAIILNVEEWRVRPDKPNSPIRYSPVYTYQLEGREIIVTDRAGASKSPIAYRKGDRVEVFVCPGHPDRLRVGEDSLTSMRRNLRMGGIVTGIGFLIYLFPILFPNLVIHLFRSIFS